MTNHIVKTDDSSLSDSSNRCRWLLIPFHNRWGRLVIYLWASAASTVIYKGWAPLSAMLFQNGAYRWQCDESWWDVNTKPCTKQDNSVQALYTTALIGLNTACMLGGLAYDRLGPRWTCAIGQFAFISGMVMLGISTQSIQLYIPAFIFLSSSISFVAFPTFVACDFFPSRAGLVASLINAFQTICTIVPVLLQLILNSSSSLTFMKIILGYTFIITIPTAVLLLCALPLRRTHVKETSLDKQLTRSVSEEGIQSTQHIVADFDVDSVVTLLPHYDKPLSDTSHKSDTSAKPVRTIDESKYKELTKPATRDFDNKWKQFAAEVCTVEYLSFAAFSAIGVLSTGFYPTTVLSRHGLKMLHFLGIVTSCLVVPSVCMGIIVDYTRTPAICIGLMLANGLSFGFAISTFRNLQYAGIILHVICLSFIYTTRLTYIQETFAKTNFGTLVGFIATVTGLLFPINIAIKATGKYEAAFTSYLVLIVVGIFINAFLWTRQRRGINYKHFVTISKITSNEVDCNEVDCNEVDV